MSKNLTPVNLILSFFLMALLPFQTLAQAAEISELQFNPQDLDSAQLQYRGPHLVTWQKNRVSDFLLVTLGGTNSLPSDMKEIALTAVEMGFQTIGLDYNNKYISTTCKSSLDYNCFDQFRQTVVQGKQGPEFLNVDSANSLETRLATILTKLGNIDPKRWSRFMDQENSKIQWSKIVVVGHSQGSGHAAYLAKNHPLKSVILLAGPQDRYETGLENVNWLHAHTETQSRAYLGLLHSKDFFKAQYQLEGLAVLREENQSVQPTYVGLEAPESSGHGILISNAEVRDGHMAVIQKQFKKLWQYLLTEALNQ